MYLCGIGYRNTLVLQINSVQKQAHAVGKRYLLMRRFTSHWWTNLPLALDHMRTRSECLFSDEFDQGKKNNFRMS